MLFLLSSTIIIYNNSVFFYLVVINYFTSLLVEELLYSLVVECPVPDYLKTEACVAWKLRSLFHPYPIISPLLSNCWSFNNNKSSVYCVFGWIAEKHKLQIASKFNFIYRLLAPATSFSCLIIASLNRYSSLSCGVKTLCR